MSDSGSSDKDASPRAPIRPPTLGDWITSSQSYESTHSTTGSSRNAVQAHHSVSQKVPPNPPSHDQPREPRTENVAKEKKSRSRRHIPHGEGEQSRKRSHHPTTSAFVDVPTPAASNTSSSVTSSFRVNDYVHDTSPSISEAAASQSSRKKSKSKSHRSSHPTQQSQPRHDAPQDWDSSRSHVRKPQPPTSRHRQEDSASYQQTAPDSPGPSVSEVMEIRARQERRSQKSHSQSEQQPNQSSDHDTTSHASSHDNSTASSSMTTKKPSGPPTVLRIVTLLIKDFRTDPPDHQLTEVRIPLKDAEECFWADAKDLCDELQIGPARIDGPAKVYTMRGRYKQYFLRVTIEGSNDCTPSNLWVNLDRTMDVFVEHAPSNTAGIQAAMAMRFQMHTPVTDHTRSPSSHHIVSPRPYAPYQADNFHSSYYEYDDTERPQSAVPHKRRYSSRSSPRHEMSPEDRSSYEDHDLAVTSRHLPIKEMSTSSRGTHRSESLSSSRKPRRRRRSAPAPEDELSFPDPYKSLEVPAPDRLEPEPSPPRPLVQSPPPVQEQPPSPVALASPQDAPTSPSLLPPVTAFEPPSEISLPPASQVADLSSSLPGPSASKKPKLLQRPDSMVSSAEPSPIAPPKASWGAFGVSQAFVSGGVSAYGSTPSPSSGAFGSLMTSPGFGGASQFGSTGVFRQTSGFAASAFQAATPRFGAGWGGAPQPSFGSGVSAPATSTTSPELDDAVGQYLRSIFVKEPGWKDFVESRSRVITIAELIRLQYSYVQSKTERYIGMEVPTGSQPEKAVGAVINKTQVLKAFNMPLAWGEECTDILHLTSLYGPSGKYYEDPQVVTMMDTKPPVTTGMFAKQFLAVLRDIHAEWEADHEEL